VPRNRGQNTKIREAAKIVVSTTRSFRSRSHNAVIRVYDDAGNVIQTHEHTGDFKEAVIVARAKKKDRPLISTLLYSRSLLALRLKNRGCLLGGGQPFFIGARAVG